MDLLSPFLCPPPVYYVGTAYFGKTGRVLLVQYWASDISKPFSPVY